MVPAIIYKNELTLLAYVNFRVAAIKKLLMLLPLVQVDHAFQDLRGLHCLPQDLQSERITVFMQYRKNIKNIETESNYLLSQYKNNLTP